MNDSAHPRPTARKVDAATLVVVGLLLMGCAIRFAVHEELTNNYGFFYYPPPISDMAIHLDLAKEVAAGRFPQPVMYTNPGYYHLLALVFKLGGDQEVMFILQMLLGACIGPLLFSVLRRYGMRFSAAALTGMCFALYQPFVFYEQFLLLEPLHNICIAILLATLTGLRTGWVQSMAASLLIGALHLLRPNIAVLWPVVLWWQHRRGASRMMLVAMVALWIPFFLFIPARNWVLGGTPVPGTLNFGDNVYIGNHSGSNGTFNVADGYQQLRKEADALPPARQTGFWLRKTRDSWDSQAGWFRLLGRKLLLLWGAWELPNNISLQAMESRSRSLAAPFLMRFGLLAPLGLVGIVLLALDRRSELRRLGRLLAASMAIFTVTIAAFVVLGRYRLPIATLLAIGAGQTLGGLATDKERRWRIAAAVILLFYLINGPMNLKDCLEIRLFGFPDWLRY
ncbi:MAG: hypothetical protein BWY66_01865 [bacterium ADurb.Bin374]|nr:MAG: hypothetical protein BWY66_01865 [bacterium ADurb.Bin374]